MTRGYCLNQATCNVTVFNFIPRAEKPQDALVLRGKRYLLSVVNPRSPLSWRLISEILQWPNNDLTGSSFSWPSHPPLLASSLSFEASGCLLLGRGCVCAYVWFLKWSPRLTGSSPKGGLIPGRLGLFCEAALEVEKIPDTKPNQPRPRWMASGEVKCAIHHLGPG